jgi:nuclear pore complex protein Nup53
MNLGSPTGSPSASFLPSFLAGEQIPAPRTTLSPTKRTLAFGSQSPSDFNRSVASPDFNRSTSFQQQRFNAVSNLYSHQTPTRAPTQTPGPPTQGLFDTLRSDNNVVHTPVRHGAAAVQQQNTPTIGFANTSAHFNRSESFLNQSVGFNASQCIASPMSSSFRPGHQPSFKDFWITVFGFPAADVSQILSHFSQCGNIVDKIFPTQNGNWIHLKYNSRLECDKALNYNCKVICNNLMIGVIHCNDPSVVDKENFDGQRE